MSSVGNLYEISVSENETLVEFSSGQNGIVLVFIPDTIGISSQLQLKNLRNYHHKILSAGWKILIVSSANPQELNESSDELSLPFQVMHDIDNRLATSFNTLGTDFENPYISKRTKRRTYILDSNLSTLHVIDDIHPANHANEILVLLRLENDIGANSVKRSEEPISEN